MQREQGRGRSRDKPEGQETEGGRATGRQRQQCQGNQGTQGQGLPEQARKHGKLGFGAACEGAEAGHGTLLRLAWSQLPKRMSHGPRRD